MKSADQRIFAIARLAGVATVRSGHPGAAPARRLAPDRSHGTLGLVSGLGQRSVTIRNFDADELARSLLLHRDNTGLLDPL